MCPIKINYVTHNFWQNANKQFPTLLLFFELLTIFRFLKNNFKIFVTIFRWFRKKITQRQRKTPLFWIPIRFKLLCLFVNEMWIEDNGKNILCAKIIKISAPNRSNSIRISFIYLYLSTLIFFFQFHYRFHNVFVTWFSIFQFSPPSYHFCFPTFCDTNLNCFILIWRIFYHL